MPSLCTTPISKREGLKKIKDATIASRIGRQIGWRTDRECAPQRLEAQFTAVSRTRRLRRVVSCRVVSCRVASRRRRSLSLFYDERTHELRSIVRSTMPCVAWEGLPVDGSSLFAYVRYTLRASYRYLISHCRRAISTFAYTLFVRLYQFCALFRIIVARSVYVVSSVTYVPRVCVCVYMCRLRGIAWRRAPRLNDRYATFGFEFGSAGFVAKFIEYRGVSRLVRPWWGD